MARLTEQERQDIIRYIEADKPLPDKYRRAGTKGLIAPYSAS